MDALDKLFKDKLSNLEQDPKEGAFDKINATLPKGSAGGSKNIFLLKKTWYRIAAALAIFSIVLYAIIEFSSKNELKNTPEQIEANAPTKNIPTDSTKTVEEKKSETPLKKQDKKKVIENSNALPPMGNPMMHKDSVSDHK